MTIRATVQRGKVSRELIRTNVIVQRVDGGSIAAQMQTRQDMAASEIDLLTKVFKDADFPTSLYGARLTREPYYDAAKRKTIIEFEVFVDWERYKAFADSLRDALKKINAPSRQQTLRYRLDNGLSAWNLPRGTTSAALTAVGSNVLTVVPQDKMGIVLYSNNSPSVTTYIWEGYVLNEDVFSDLQSLFLLRNWHVRLEGQNTTGVHLYSADFRVPNFSWVKFDTRRNPVGLVLIYPVLLRDRWSDWDMSEAFLRDLSNRRVLGLYDDGRSVKMSVELDWTAEQLRNLGSVRFSFHGK